MRTCSNCQTNNELEADFCQNCGQSIGGNVTTPPENQSNDEVENTYAVEATIPAEDLFVGKKADYYNRKWKKGAQKNGLAFNIAGFLLSFLWLGYRKVYKPIFIAAVVFLVIDIFLYLIKYEYPVTSFINPIDQAIGYAVTFTMAFYGNAMYKRHVDKKINLINHTTTNESAREELYKKKGGTSWLGVLWAILILALVYIIPSAFIPMNFNSIENIQKSTFEYSLDNKDYTVSMEKMLGDTFTDGKWDYVDKSSSKEYVNFTGVYTEYGDTYDFVITFFAETYEEEILMTDITIDGEALDFDDQVEALNFLLSLME